MNNKHDKQFKECMGKNKTLFTLYDIPSEKNDFSLFLFIPEISNIKSIVI